MTSSPHERIANLQRRYRFAVETLWTVPEEMRRLYGNPIRVEKTVDGICLLFRGNHPDGRWRVTLFHFRDDFSGERLVYESETLFGLAADPDHDRLLLGEIDLRGLKDDRTRALAAPGNRLATLHADGRLQVLRGALPGKPFFPMCISVLPAGGMVYFDLAAGEIVAADADGTPRTVYPAPGRLLRQIEAGADGASLWFIAMARYNWYNHPTGDEYETMYRLTPPQPAQAVFSSGLTGITGKQMLALAPVGEDVWYSDDTDLVKIDGGGREVCRLSLWAEERGERTTLTCLRRDPRDAGVVYGISAFNGLSGYARIEIVRLSL